MVNEKLFEKRNEYTKYFGQIYGYGTPEATSAKVDTVVLCDLMFELLEEVKALREEVKATKTTEEPKAKAPTKTATK